MMDCNYPASGELFSYAGQHFATRESKENPLKRKKTDLAHEDPELQTNDNRVKRRRTETGEHDVKTGKTEACVETSCSVPTRESKENPLRRKRMDLAHEEPELKTSEHEVKKRRTVREEKDGKTERTETCTDFSSVTKEEPGVPRDGRQDRQRMMMEKSRRTEKEKTDRFFYRYILGKLLGKGSFGYVHAGIRISDRKNVALKFMKRETCDRYITFAGDTCRRPLEVALMEMVCKPPHCPYVIQLLDWIETSTLLILVLERPDPCIDLFDYSTKVSMTESQAKIVLLQVIKAAHHCQERNVIHRDIKEENILLNPQTLGVKLIDFGCGVIKDTPNTVFAGTMNFQPPEWILKHQYEAEPSTVWGLGLIMYRLLCEVEPFNGAQEIVDGHLNFPNQLSEASRSLMRWSLHPDPKSRPTLEQMLTHHWF